MQVYALCGLLLLAGLLVVGLIRNWWPLPAQPLYLQVEAEVENIEWLLITLLRAAPRAELIIIDRASGETRRILQRFARRYQLRLLDQAPADCPLLHVRPGTLSADLLQQYQSLQHRKSKENVRRERSKGNI